MIGSFFAIDWIVVKATIFIFGRSVFAAQKSFLEATYTIYPWCDVTHQEIGEEILTGSIQLRVDAFNYNSDLKYIRNCVKEVELPELPWFVGLVGSDSRESAEWEKVKDTYHELTEKVRGDMDTALGNWIPGLSLNNRMHWSRVGRAPVGFLLFCLSYVAPLHLLTYEGWKRWWSVGEAYFGTMLIFLGIWTTHVANDFEIVKKFESYKALNGLVYSHIGEGKKIEEDIFTKIENDEKVAFSQFVSAVTLGRIALLQIVPHLTLGSVILSSVASSPLFVGPFFEAKSGHVNTKNENENERKDAVFDIPPVSSMREKLPPLIFFGAFKEAKTMLDADSNTSRLLVLFFGYYILINHSRLIQFFINGYFCVVSIAIIFGSHILWLLVPVLMIILIHQGLLSAIFVVLLFIKLLFRKSNEDGTLSGQADWNVMLQRRVPERG